MDYLTKHYLITFPLREARCKAVFPLLVAALTCAPLDNKPATTDA